MRVLRASFLARRMGSAWLLLSCLMASVLVTAALIAALVDFYSGVLPNSVRQELGPSGQASVVVSGSTSAGQTAPVSAAVAAWTRTAFGSIPFRLYRDVSSDYLKLPGPELSGNVPVVQAAAMQDITAHGVLTAGTWPASPQPGQPVPVALPTGTAKLLHAGIGSVLTLTDLSTRATVRLRVTGLFARRDSASPYWSAAAISQSGETIAGGFSIYGPAVVSPSALGLGGTAGSGTGSPALAQGAVSFAAVPDAAGIGPANLISFSDRLSAAVSSIQNSPAMSQMNASTALPAVLANIARQLAAARMLVIISALQLLILAAAALALAGRLLASHRDDECALLTARGAARWQLVKPSVAEAVLACAVAAVIGALAGGWLAELLQPGRGNSAAGPVGSSLAAWLAVAVVFAMCLLIVIWPALRPAGIAEVRVRRGRQALVATTTAAGADVALIVLAVLCVRELRSYSAASAAVTAGFDPVIAVAPAVALAGLAVVALRLLPLAARGLERLSSRGRRLGTAMANWEISRRPVRQSGPVLLVILAVGAGTLALAQYASWRQSVTDQANFSVGADVRVDLTQAQSLPAASRIGRLPGVTAAMAVSQTGYTSGVGEVMAVTAGQAAAAVLLRRDLSSVSAARLWGQITPSAQAGLAIPGRPARLAITASVAPGTAGDALGPVSALVTVQDATGATYQLPAGSIAADGRPHELLAQIAPAGVARYPLRFLGLSLTYNWPSAGNADSPATVSITGLAESPAAAGPVGRPFAAGRALAGFDVAVSATDLAFLNTVDGSGTPRAPAAVKPLELNWSKAGSAQRLVFEPGTAPAMPASLVREYALQDLTAQITILAGDPVRDIPVIATSAFLRANHLHVGSATSMTVGSVVIPLRIVAAVSQFPTVSGGGALIADQAAVQDALAANGGLPLPVTQWWLSTAGGATPAGLPAGASVLTAARAAAALRSQPLSAAPVQGAVAMSAAAALLAAFGFCVSVAASVRRRRSQRALLAALGVPPTAQARLFCLEEAMLSAPAAAVGLGIGVLLAHLLIPAMTVSGSAGKPMPTVLVHVPFGWVALLALAVPAVPVLAAAFSAVRQPDPAAELRVAEAA